MTTMTAQAWCNANAGRSACEVPVAEFEAVDFGHYLPVVDHSDRLTGQLVESGGPVEYRPLDLYRQPDGTLYLVAQYAETGDSNPECPGDTLVAGNHVARLLRG